VGEISVVMGRPSLLPADYTHLFSSFSVNEA